jgi:hypothetical protein
MFQLYKVEMYSNEIHICVLLGKWKNGMYIMRVRLELVKICGYDSSLRVMASGTVFFLTGHNHFIHIFSRKRISWMHLTPSNTVTRLKMAALWDVAPRSLVAVDRRFGGAYCLHNRRDEWVTHRLMMEAQFASLKRRSASRRLHSAIFKKAATFIPPWGPQISHFSAKFNVI